MSEKPTAQERWPAPNDPSYSVVSAGFMPDFLTAEETADWLRTTKGAVLGGLQRGEIPGRKIGGEWRISTAAVLAVFREAMPGASTS